MTTCPSDHWNDGNDCCADCGIDLNPSPREITCRDCGGKTNSDSSPDGECCPECYDIDQCGEDFQMALTIPHHGGHDPDGINERRTEWGARAIRQIMQDTGTEVDTALTDLLADLMHWAHGEERNFAEALETACYHFQMETAKEPGL